MVGRKQEIAIGHLSGGANVRSFLEERGLPPDSATVRELMAVAKAQRVLLSDQSVRDALALDRAAGK